MDALSILTKTKSLIEDDMNWTQGNLRQDFKDHHGNVFKRCFCIVGALCYAAEVPNLILHGENQQVDKAMALLCEPLAGSRFECDTPRMTLTSFNDSPRTGHKEVVELLNKAMKVGENNE